jgi:hypothetical protein
LVFKKGNARVLRTFVWELWDRARDRERGAWLEPLVHVLAQHAALVFLDEDEISLVLWARNGYIWADDRIALLAKRRPVGAFGRTNDDE